MNLTKIALNISIVLSLSISASWACLSKPIDPNKIRTIAPTISRQNLQALYPGVQSIDTKLRTAPQHLTQKLGHEALNANSLNKVQEESARTIFHALNDTLNLLLTHSDLIKSAMASNMSVLRGTSLIMISNDDGIQVIPTLSILQHDVADVVNALHMLNDLQKNIDVVAYIKQTIFHQNSVHFYQHNDASFMWPPLSKT
ncbi:MAG: hypothetical protein K2X98_06370 [Alphaproteobacteria bacterium]|nr:hypothetical protein [Alphaproteobacteria bacterium]